MSAEQDKGWVEYFNGTLNQPGPAQLHDMGEVELAADFAVNVGPIAVSKVKKVVHLLKRGKAAGLDEISLKLLKHMVDLR